MDKPIMETETEFDTFKDKFKARNSKSVLQFWSGGADSTYLALQNLMAGHSVTLTYVDIVNNATKVERENKARELLKKDIDIFCDYFKCQTPIYMEGHSIFVNYPLSNCRAPQQIIFAMFALLMGGYYSEVQMGVVCGDSMQGVPLNQEVVKVYRDIIDYDFPPIKYPLEYVSKEAIYLTLRGYDNLLGTKFLQHITVCESDNKQPCAKKKLCHPCKVQERVFRRLKWIE